MRVCVCVCVCTHIDANTGIPARGALPGHACASGTCHIIIHTCHIIIHTCHIIIQAYPHEEHCRDMLVLAARLHDITKAVQAHVTSSYTHVTSSYPFSKSPLYASPNQCRHHTYYVTSSYILCHIIIHTMSHHHTYYVTSSPNQCRHPFSKSPLYALLQ